MKNIIIYSKDYCPYCVKAKNLLTSIGATYEEVDVTYDPDVFMQIYAKSHMRTVPQIFLGDECLGGFDSINAMHERGELVGKLSLEK